jgi:HPt (histidine-containing phosphotransfer) domain-containing protein
VPDWTIILTTLGASGITGAVAYTAAKTQGKTAIAQTEAETKRLRIGHAEEHLRNRQATYHNLLTVLSRFDSVVWAGFLTGEGEFQQFLSECHHLINGAVLFGAEPVRQAAARLEDLINKIEIHVVAANLPFDEALQEAHESLGADLADVRRQLIDAMRTDVAPRESH